MPAEAFFRTTALGDRLPSHHQIILLSISEPSHRHLLWPSCRYGKVFKSHLFLSPTIVSCDHELNNFILQNEDRFFQGSYPKPVHGVLGKNSLLVVVGETHKRLRTMALALVNATKAKPGYLNDIETMATYVMTRWKGKEEVYFYDEARKVRMSE